MHDLGLVFEGNDFSGYEFSVNITVSSGLPIKMQHKLNLNEVIGETSFTLVSPIADIDLMLEMSAKKFYLDKMKHHELKIDDVSINMVIDPEGDHNDQSTALSALFAWMNHHDLDNDAVRESVVDLSLHEQKMIITYCERKSVDAKKLETLISYFTENPERSLLTVAEKLCHKH